MDHLEIFVPNLLSFDWRMLDSLRCGTIVVVHVKLHDGQLHAN